jgi:hypothetical protein
MNTKSNLGFLLTESTKKPPTLALVGEGILMET